MQKILDLDKLWNRRLGIVDSDYSYVGTKKQFTRWLGVKIDVLPYMRFNDIEELSRFNRSHIVSMPAGTRYIGKPPALVYRWNLRIWGDSRWFREGESFTGQSEDSYDMAFLQVLLSIWETKQLRKSQFERLKAVEEQSNQTDPDEIVLVAEPYPLLESNRKATKRPRKARKQESLT